MGRNKAHTARGCHDTEGKLTIYFPFAQKIAEIHSSCRAATFKTWRAILYVQYILAWKQDHTMSVTSGTGRDIRRTGQRSDNGYY
ncbi:hypothetical protein MACH17_19290 [Phaeobacter inhibens]|nr:hypothetical protein MACH17_19290 [Phaeobacter inhibens]